MDILNKLHCIIIKSDYSIEDKFEKYLSTFLDPYDGDYLAGDDDIGDDGGEKSIYLTYINKDKIDKMIEFFKEHDILLFFEEVNNLISLICSDEKYMKLYSDERNKPILDKYIKYHVSTDDILDRMIDEKVIISNLLPIEIEILNNN